MKMCHILFVVQGTFLRRSCVDDLVGGYDWCEKAKTRNMHPLIVAPHIAYVAKGKGKRLMLILDAPPRHSAHIFRETYGGRRKNSRGRFALPTWLPPTINTFHRRVDQWSSRRQVASISISVAMQNNS
jgi:hypothetical protein